MGTHWRFIGNTLTFDNFYVHPVFRNAPGELKKFLIIVFILSE